MPSAMVFPGTRSQIRCSPKEAHAEVANAVVHLIGIDPNDLVKQRGAEIARLLACSVNYVEDIRIFDLLLDRIGKLRGRCEYFNLAA